MSEEDCIHFWVLSKNQSYRSIEMVLEILKSKYNVNVPKSARTLLKTRRSNEGIMDIPGGKYWYNGIRNCISKYFRPLVEDLKDVLVNGIEIQNAHVSIKLRAIIADSPARSFIKGKRLSTKFV
uniref:Uncharacterized protein n=1 Tax=Anopheles quadriannulatus TaxID=34691 RepID=A0A182XQ14_ANOQN